MIGEALRVSVVKAVAWLETSRTEDTQPFGTKLPETLTPIDLRPVTMWAERGHQRALMQPRPRDGHRDWMNVD